MITRINNIRFCTKKQNSNNSVSFRGKEQLVSILNPTEMKKLAEYEQKFGFSETKPISYGIKRAADIILSALGLAVTAPLMLASVIAIKLDSKGSFLFKQARIGKDGKPFTIYKLRTMKPNSGNEILQNGNDERVTRIGKFLRKYSIDEFPQFINIIKGDMSFIGPRPLNITCHNLRKDDTDFFLRYSVKPGASLLYPYRKSIDSRPNMRINAEKNYIENWSLTNDLKIFMKIMLRIINGGNY